MSKIYNYEAEEYQDLAEVISLDGIDYSATSYWVQETKILQPRLEALGYTEIRWLPGETDSFGPLSRVCRCFDKDGELHWFVYG